MQVSPVCLTMLYIYLTTTDPITKDLDLTTMNPSPTNTVPDPIITDPETTTTYLDRITIPDPFVLKTYAQSNP